MVGKKKNSFPFFFFPYTYSEFGYFTSITKIKNKKKTVRGLGNLSTLMSWIHFSYMWWYNLWKENGTQCVFIRKSNLLNLSSDQVYTFKLSLYLTDQGCSNVLQRGPDLVIWKCVRADHSARYSLNNLSQMQMKYFIKLILQMAYFSCLHTEYKF